MAAELADRSAILMVVRRFPSLGAADSRSLRSESHGRMEMFIRRSTNVPFRRFGGMYIVSSCTAFLGFYMARWVPIFVLPCGRVVHFLLHASLPRGLRLPCLSSFLFTSLNLWWWIPLLPL
jgi:hypothetical protein